MSWREKLARARDTATDAAFKATDKFVRCPSSNADGKVCDLNRGHGGSHENGTVTW